MFHWIDSILSSARMLTMMTLAAGLLFSFTDTSDAADDDGKAKKTEPQHALDFKVLNIDEEPFDLSQYKGDVVLIVNVASRCGHTKQYKDLQAIHEKYAEQGLRVLGFPCNQFGRQEPGTNEQIKEFCSVKFNVTFPMFAKVDVNGEEAAPFFKYLTSDDRDLEITGKVKWNFEKFLISRDGKLIQRFRSRSNPTSKEMTEAIETALAVK